MNQTHPYSLSIQQTYCTNHSSDSSYSFFPTIPISPPAPHRKAPSPPVYSPRRNRARHINMREPAQLGLYTVSESEEDSHNRTIEMKSTSSTSLKPKFLYNLPSAVPSSEIFPSPSPSPSPSAKSQDSVDSRTLPMDVPRDIDEDMEMDEKLNRLSWSSKGSLTSNSTFTGGETESDCFITTPLLESDDPFGWSTSTPFSSDSFEPDVEMTEDTIGGNLFTPLNLNKKPTLAESIKTGSSRRPPPLTLSTRFLTPIATPTSAKSSSNLFSAISNASTAESDLILTPRTATSPTPGSLLPSLPIISSIEWASKVYSSDITSPIIPTRPHRHTHVRSKTSKRKSPDDPIDLAMALEDLLTSCGEKFDQFSTSDSEFSGPNSISSSSYASTSESESDSEINGFETKSLRFPLPPTRVHHSSINPKTPSPIRKNFNQRPLTPYAPKKDRKNIRSNSNSNSSESPLSLKGDHSFLISLSMGEEIDRSYKSVGSSSSSTSSFGSNSSRKSLPGRKSLPSEWMKF